MRWRARSKTPSSAEGTAMFEDPEFWVALAFVIFVGVLVKFGVPKMALSALDARGDRIKQALDEAHRLRSEAQALADVRAAAADAAVAAAEKVLVQTTHGAAAESLIAKGISDLKAKLN